MTSDEASGYGRVDVHLPFYDPDKTAYARFVNSKGGFGDHENPSELEVLLPQDFESNGSSQISEGVWCSVSYKFPKHPTGLSRGEVVKVTRTLAKLGADGWGFARHSV